MLPQSSLTGRSWTMDAGPGPRQRWRPLSVAPIATETWRQAVAGQLRGPRAPRGRRGFTRCEPGTTSPAFCETRVPWQLHSTDRGSVCERHFPAPSLVPLELRPACDGRATDYEAAAATVAWRPASRHGRSRPISRRTRELGQGGSGGRPGAGHDFSSARVSSEMQEVR